MKLTVTLYPPSTSSLNFIRATPYAQDVVRRVLVEIFGPRRWPVMN